MQSSDLTDYESIFVFWYRSLNTLERLAVNCFLTRGDDRLILALRDRSDRLKRFDYHALTNRHYELALHW
jgi:hypothetical protein